MKIKKNYIQLGMVLLPFLLLCACDGKDGKPGQEGSLVSTTAKVLNIKITNTKVENGNFTLEFNAKNELQQPVIKISHFKLNFAQLKPGINGNASAWQTLNNEECNVVKECKGKLIDNNDGSYIYTMGTPLSGPANVNFNQDFIQRLNFTVIKSERLPQTSSILDFNLNGSEIKDTRAIVEATQCLNCHDSISAIKHGGDKLENCSICHTENNMTDITKTWPILAHTVHIGVSPEPLGNCQTCHTMDTTNELLQGQNWKTVPTREACSSCHDMTKNTVYDHKTQLDNSQCLTCHQPENIQDVHLDKYLTAKTEDQRSIVTVDMREAKLVKENDEHYAMISFALLDKDGAEISMPENNPANADWIANLQLYVNWGTSVDFTNSRGYTIFVKSNKKDITQDGSDGITPAGERARTPLHSVERNVFTYKVGPVIVNDPISGDLLNDTGFISERLIFCFDENQKRVKCGTAGHSKNATWNNRWFFTKNGLTTELFHKRPSIVSNAKCGSCHGYDELRDNTQLACRSCHSQPTAINKELADTTCFSGHDHGPNGEHLRPFEIKALKPTGKPSFINSTADIVDPCLACHNPNTPPTQAIREMHTKANDWDYVEQLTVSHPDYKVWMHSLHTNQRATQSNENGVRSISYPADKANCYRCHEGDTFGVERLTETGRPLALDLDYNPDSRAHPATDISVDAYSSPVSATCYACHANTIDIKGKRVINKSVRAHMEQHGGRFGVPLDQIKVESCAVCHSVENLKEVHGISSIMR